MKKNNKYEFWISNVTDLNVCLRDLAYTVPARAHKNLLDERHFRYTREELEASKESGSLFRKRDKIKVRAVPPPEPVPPGIYTSKVPLFMTQNPLWSQVRISEPKYEELEISPEEIADGLSNEDES